MAVGAKIYPRGEAGVTDVRIVAVGGVIAGVHQLYWLTIRPAAVNWTVELTDAIIALQPIKWDAHCRAGGCFHAIFDPPMEFIVGIYVETLVGVTSVTIGYM